jgi:hypothetical protein
MGNIFPWNDKFDDKADIILDHLRADMVLDMKESFIPEHLTTSAENEFFYTNMEGQRFAASVREENSRTKVDDRRYSNHRDGNVGRDESGVEEDDTLLFDVDKINSKLEGVCAHLSSDWWTYEWCHRYEQFLLKIRFLLIIFHVYKEVKSDNFTRPW